MGRESHSFVSQFVVVAFFPPLNIIDLYRILTDFKSYLLSPILDLVFLWISVTCPFSRPYDPFGALQSQVSQCVLPSSVHGCPLLPLPPSSALLTCARSHTVHAGGVFAVLAQSPVTLPEGLSGFTAVASRALTPNSKRESHRQKGQRKEEGTNHRSSQGTPRGEDKI